MATRYILENQKNLDKLPSWPLFMAFPLKVKDVSGSRVRAVTLMHREG